MFGEKENLDMDTMTQILEKLVERTQEGKINWRTTVDPDAFAAVIDTLGVVVSSRGPSLMEHSPYFKIQIMNRNGKTAEVIETADASGSQGSGVVVADGEQAQTMARLFRLARHSALDVDTTLEGTGRATRRDPVAGLRAPSPRFASRRCRGCYNPSRRPP